MRRAVTSSAGGLEQGSCESHCLLGYAGLGCFPARAAADLPFKVLSAGHVKGQAEAGQSEARDAKALAGIWSKLGLRGLSPR